ncbi:uncharacterized protein LOC126619975 [Malus sylvestris]|uniref:uncharacterized protein LOC126619975 n=1 Tax=Malus sylvestris TaxID=3752 RepID=UPI0021ACC33B|nr:uncharacterized protein LOC126619975 [Malus sylvestris]
MSQHPHVLPFFNPIFPQPPQPSHDLPYSQVLHFSSLPSISSSSLAPTTIPPPLEFVDSHASSSVSLVLKFCKRQGELGFGCGRTGAPPRKIAKLMHASSVMLNCPIGALDNLMFYVGWLKVAMRINE